MEDMLPRTAPPVSIRRGCLAVLAMWVFTSSDASAQTAHVHAPPADAPASSWSWDANLFFGWNYQQRKFRDFQKVESMNNAGFTVS